MMKRFLPVMLTLLVAPLAADEEEARTWRNADATASFPGRYVSIEGKTVTIRRNDGRTFTLSLDNLHKTDLAWLRSEKGITKDGGRVPVTSAAVFDNLRFGDDRDEVETELKQSDIVVSKFDDTFLGRFGLNGTFRTKQRIGGLHCELYFDWTRDGHLDEISLRTAPLDSSEYDKLEPNWSELSTLLSTLHGKAVQTKSFPDREDLENDVFLASHLWRLEDGGSALLGTSMQAGKYMVVVRFTTANIKPNRVP